MKKIVLTVVAILALIALVLLVIQSQSPASLPATYKGISLPTPAPVGDTQLPPIWLIIRDQAIHGTLQSFHLSNGQVFESDVDALLQAGELATVTFSANEQVVIIGTKSITGIQVKIVNDAPRGFDTRSLRADGKAEGDTVVFTLEPFGYTSNQFLRVSMDFKEGDTLGNVTYTWQLIPTTGSASFTPTLDSFTGALPPCDILPDPAPTPPVLPTVPPDLIYRSPEEMTREADLIILGTVVDPSIGHFDPPLGSSEIWDSPEIVTDTAVQVECVLKGASAETRIMVRTDGGCVGEECMVVSHGAQIQLGQRAIMFLVHKGFDYVTARKPGGVYEVQADYEYYAFGDYLDIAGNRIVSDYYDLSVAELLSIIQNNNR